MVSGACSNWGLHIQCTKQNWYTPYNVVFEQILNLSLLLHEHQHLTPNTFPSAGEQAGQTAEPEHLTIPPSIKQLSRLQLVRSMPLAEFTFNHQVHTSTCMTLSMVIYHYNSRMHLYRAKCITSWVEKHSASYTERLDRISLVTKQSSHSKHSNSRRYILWEETLHATYKVKGTIQPRISIQFCHLWHFVIHPENLILGVKLVMYIPMNLTCGSNEDVLQFTHVLTLSLYMKRLNQPGTECLPMVTNNMEEWDVAQCPDTNRWYQKLDYRVDCIKYTYLHAFSKPLNNIGIMSSW